MLVRMIGMPRKSCYICGDGKRMPRTFCSRCGHDQLDASIWYATAPLYERSGRIPQRVPTVLLPRRKREEAKR